jgi:hypothetical protein
MFLIVNGMALRRRAALMLEPTHVEIELVAWDATGADSARDGLELAIADQSANLVLGAAELLRALTDGQRRGPVHT